MKRGEGLKRTGNLARVTPLLAKAGLTARTSLSRSTPLDPGPPLPRTGRRDGKDSPRPKRAAGVPTDVRQQVYERDNHRCVRCGKVAEEGNRQLQHRVARGMGGRLEHARLSALILLCGWSATDPDGCHYVVERWRTDAQVAGYSVPMGIDPEKWGVRYPDGWYRLDDDGGRTPCKPWAGQGTL